MKRSILITILTLVCVLASGEDFKVRLSPRIGIAGAPMTAGNLFATGDPMGSSRNYYNSFPMLERYYSPILGPVKTCGVISLGLDAYLKKWFAVSADLSVTPLWMDIYDYSTKRNLSKQTGVGTSLLIKAKFVFFNKPVVRMYASAGLGAVYYSGFDKLRWFDSSQRRYVEENLRFQIQTAPFGIEVGKKFFGFCEFGLGTLYMGIQAGVGYNF